MSAKFLGKPGFCVVPDIERPPRDVIDRLAKFPVAILGDAMGRRGIMDRGIKPLNSKTALCGPVVTVEVVVGDNLMIHAALKLAQPGDVLVVNAYGDMASGLWGELTTSMAIRKGLGGFIIDGAVRDGTELAESGFPVFPRGVCPRGGEKDGPGQVNMPISCGGVAVNPGDMVVGDGDGVVVVPRHMAEATIEAAQKRIDAEAARFDAIRNGPEDGIYPGWLIPTLRAKGILGEGETL
jgi:4-hydroxy-4-methyl-2-oxoglutarate aldolase